MAEYEGGVSGYIMGSKDEPKYRRVSAELSRLSLKRTLGRFLFKSYSRSLLFSLVKKFYKCEWNLSARIFPALSGAFAY